MHSFVGAATQLRLSKATVSKAISRIERRLGARLFNRAARRLAVTRILAEGEAAEDDGMAQSAAPHGHGRLTAPMSYGLVRGAPIRPEFLERYPTVTIDLHLSDSHVSGRDTTPPFASHSLPDSFLIGRILAPVSRFLVATPQAISQGTAARHIRFSSRGAGALLTSPHQARHGIHGGRRRYICGAPG